LFLAPIAAASIHCRDESGFFVSGEKQVTEKDYRQNAKV
jgi:hypothetical protein